MRVAKVFVDLSENGKVIGRGKDKRREFQSFTVSGKEILVSLVCTEFASVNFVHIQLKFC